ncbi:hypothetical protein ACOSQ4_026127 [Xanthoceras sorbifolium]
MADSDSNSTPSSNNSVIAVSPEEMQRIFNQFDANGDGMISIDELGGVLKALGSSYTDEELRRVMDDVDTDKDGKISMSEFASFCRSSAADDELRDAFDLYDHNRNGLISATELHSVLQRLKMGCSKEDCVNMIKSVDSDGDGHVNFEEFRKMMGKSGP